MQLFSLQIVNGLTIGMIYGLSALGFTMVFKALGDLNFAHLNTITIGAFAIYIVVTTSNIPFVLAMPVGVGIMLLFGYLEEKLLFKRFQHASPMAFMMVSISLSTVLTNLCQLVFGPQPRSLTNVFPNKDLSFLGVKISYSNLCILVIALTSLAILQLFFFKTRFGLALRLASEDASTASLMGVKPRLMRSATFAITAALGGISGMLISPLYSVTIELGASLGLKMFIAAVIGGLGNFVGAIFGGLLIGITESLSSTYISSTYKDLIVYVVGIVVLAIFPYGIFRRVKNKY